MPHRATHPRRPPARRSPARRSPARRARPTIVATLLVALLVALLTAPAPAQSPASPVAVRRDTIPIALTVSGGVSLGAYQSGVNWALSRFFKRAGLDSAYRQRHGLPVYDLVAVAGASAGNINGVLSALEWCDATLDEPPEASIFWKAWVTTGWKQLFPYRSTVYPAIGVDPDRTRSLSIWWRSARAEQLDSIPLPATRGTPDTTLVDDGAALFHRLYFQRSLFPRIDALLDDPRSQRPCEVPIGITITRLVPDELEVRPGIRVSVQRFAAVLEIHVDSTSGGRVGFRQADHDVRHDASLGALIALPSTATSRAVERNDVYSLILASSAFPIAFAPRVLRYYHADSLLDGGECPQVGTGDDCLDPETASFVDGGVFDNNPLALALGIRRTPSLPRDTLRALDSLKVVYINPGLLRGTARPVGRDPHDAIVSDGFASVLTLIAGAVPSARQYELQALMRSLERDRRLAKRWKVNTLEPAILVTDRSHAIAGAHLYAFAAFLGRPLREHDFYAGIYDGMHFAAREFLCTGAQLTHLYPREVGADTGLAGHVPDSTRRATACMRRTLSEMLAGEHLPLGEVAPHVIRIIYEEEFRQPYTPAVAQLARPRTRADSLRVLLDTTLARVNTVRPPPDPRCAREPLVDRVLCADGFTAMLERFGTDTVKRVLRRMAASADCADSVALTRPDDCHGDDIFAELVDDPNRFANHLVERVLLRLQNVERFDRRGGVSYGRAVNAAEFWYLSTNERYRRKWELDPSSIPDYESPGSWRGILALAPYHFSGAIGVSGLGFGWRPTYYHPLFDVPLALVVPIEVWKTRTWDRGGDFNRYQLMPGVGVHVQVRIPLVNSLQAGLYTTTDAGIRHLQFRPEVAGQFLGGKIRLGMRRISPRARGDKRWIGTFGLADLNGVLYWGARTVRVR